MEQDSPRLILASASPRRQDLLRDAGYDFAVHPAAIDESGAPDDLTPTNLAKHLSFEKAAFVAAQFPDKLVLAADTLVVFGDRPIGKPENADDARRIITLLAGTTHLVITGVTVMSMSGFQQTRSAISAVRMRVMAPAEIEQYVASGRWQGKAGGYGIQDPDPIVVRSGGSVSNIIGLPMEIASEMLAEAGVFPRSE
mgnify:CR=1 FL=1